MANMLEPLGNALYECILALKNLYYRLPNEVPYPISDKVYYGSELMIAIGVNKKGTQYLKIGGDCSHTYVVGQLKQVPENQISLKLY